MSLNRQYLYLSSDDAQLSLGLGEAKPSERLSFAVLPAPEQASQVEAMTRSLLEQGRVSGEPLSGDSLQVTLHHLGDYAGLPPSLLGRARAAGERLRMEPFDVRFDRLGTFGARGRRIACALRGDDGVRGLYPLQRALARRMAEQGIVGDVRFTPQIPLLQVDTALPVQRVAPVQWQVCELVLVRTFLGQGRQQFEGRWPLAA